MATITTSRLATMDELQAEIDRLHAGHARIYDNAQQQRLLIEHLTLGLIKVKTRPGNESAFIAAVFLEDAKKTFGLAWRDVK